MTTTENAFKSIDALSAKHVTQMGDIRDQLDAALTPGTNVTTDLKEKLTGLFGSAQKNWEAEVKTAYQSVREAEPENERPGGADKPSKKKG